MAIIMCYQSDRKAQDLLNFHNVFRRKSKVRFGRTSVYDFS